MIVNHAFLAICHQKRKNVLKYSIGILKIRVTFRMNSQCQCQFDQHKALYKICLAGFYLFISIEFSSIGNG